MATQPNISDILDAMHAAIKEAFERGYRAGAEEMRQKILQAAAGDDHADAPALAIPRARPIVKQSDLGMNEGEKARGWPPGRVARGTVRRVLARVMSHTDGRSIAEITDKARAIDGNISVTSIPNELRRNIGSLYRQDGSLWFLSGDPDKETAGSATNEYPAVMSN